ncbi:PqqD family protein [Chloroflexota bacterium]
MKQSSFIFQKDASIVSREIEGEVILVPIRQNVGDLESIYTLNETAARAWVLFDGERTLEQIKDEIVAEFDVGNEQARLDLIELVYQLVEAGAIHRVNEAQE